MTNDLRIMIASDDLHDRVYAEIYCGDKFIATVSQDNGPGKEELEIPGIGLIESLIQRRVALHDFLLAIVRSIDMLEGGSLTEHNCSWNCLVSSERKLDLIKDIGLRFGGRRHRSFCLVLMVLASNDAEDRNVREAALSSFFQICGRSKTSGAFPSIDEFFGEA